MCVCVCVCACDEYLSTKRCYKSSKLTNYSHMSIQPLPIRSNTGVLPSHLHGNPLNHKHFPVIHHTHTTSCEIPHWGIILQPDVGGG